MKSMLNRTASAVGMFARENSRNGFVHEIKDVTAVILFCGVWFYNLEFHSVALRTFSMSVRSEQTLYLHIWYKDKGVIL